MMENVQGKYSNYKETFIKTHLWLDDLQVLALMLEGLIKLPHLIENGRGGRLIKNCPICDDAFDVKQRYQNEKGN